MNKFCSSLNKHLNNQNENDEEWEVEFNSGKKANFN